MTNSKTGSKTPKGRDRDRKDAPAQPQKQNSRAKGSRSPVAHDSHGRSDRGSSKRQDEKTSRSWRNTSPDGQNWRETETPRHQEKWSETPRHQEKWETPRNHEKPGDVKILKKEKNREDGHAASTSSAWRPKSHSPDTIWRPASASTQASSKEDDDEDLQANFRKYLNGYRNKSPDSIISDDGDGEEDLSAAQRKWLMSRTQAR